LRAAALAIALPGGPLFFGSAGNHPAAGTSLALIYLQSQGHFMESLFSMTYISQIAGTFLNLEVPIEKNS
jgi:hypothetical protein